MSILIQDNESILFVGDDIVDSGRMNGTPPLGNGFVSLFADMTVVREPKKQIHVINSGRPDDTITRLRDRWVDDVIGQSPGWIVCMIGIHDCINQVKSDSVAITADRFGTMLNQLIAATRRALPETKVVLMDPFFAGTDDGSLLPGSLHSKIDEVLVTYIKQIAETASVFKTHHVRTHAIFHSHFQFQHPSVYFPTDRIHPNKTGNMLIAEALYACIADNALE